MFGVGDMVVCVDDLNWRGYGNEARPVRNGVYTIRGVILVGGVECVTLSEVHNRPRHYAQGFWEAHHRAFRFRKIRKPDISALRDVVQRVLA